MLVSQTVPVQRGLLGEAVHDIDLKDIPAAINLVRGYHGFNTVLLPPGFDSGTYVSAVSIHPQLEDFSTHQETSH